MDALIRWLSTSIRSAGWAPVVVFSLHVVLSRGFGAYLAVPGLDIPMHVLGGVAIAFFIWRAIALPAATPVLGRPSDTGRLLLAFTAVCTAAALWEFAEWTTDRLGLTEAQVGLDDTLLDMALGIAGGTVFLWLAHRRRSRSASS